MLDVIGSRIFLPATQSDGTYTMTEQNSFAKILVQAWDDDGFRAKLIANPSAVLRAEGIEVPAAGPRLVVVEDTEERRHLVLPLRPTELADDALNEVAGGGHSWWDPRGDWRYPSDE